MIAKKKIFVYSITLAITFLLILFCILVLIKNKNFEKEYSLDLGLPSKNFYEDLCGCSLEKILSYRSFKTYQLTSDDNQNQIISKQIQADVINIVKSNDSKKGVNVKFGIKTKYGDVVRILNICQIEKVETYILKDYDVWIMTGSNSELSKNCPFRRPKY